MPVGIYKRKFKPMLKIGDKFNKLTVIKFSHRNKKTRKQFWLFRCDCGNEKVINATVVKCGQTKSCGCSHKDINIKHGMSYTKTYKSWARMKTRCLNKNVPRYKDWGGRGITVCDEWMEFENFYRDMGNKPEGKSLDRIDNNGNYCKENCRWATPKEQANNRRNNLIL